VGKRLIFESGAVWTFQPNKKPARHNGMRWRERIALSLYAEAFRYCHMKRDAD